MFHLLSDFFPKKKEEPPKLENKTEKKLTPKPRKKRFKYKKKNWRRDVISLELLILIVFIFLPVVFYVTGHMEFNL